MDTQSPAPPPLRLLQSRARPLARPVPQPEPAQAWWQRWLPWAADRSA